MKVVINLYCISISYKNADVEVRKKFAFSAEKHNEILTDIISLENIWGCVLLCTCNRTEIYFCGDEVTIDFVKEILAIHSGFSIENLSPHLMFFAENKAISHLFKVACGIESMVIGEDEILGQTKKAYELSRENNCISYQLNMIFQSAITSAKKIKTQTALSKSSVSIATLASNEVAKLGEKVKVLVIGATGKIGSTALKNLLSHKNIQVLTTLRNHNREFDFIEKYKNIEVVEYSQRYEYINDVDCIISATSSPHYTITLHDLRKYISNDRDRLFIDLAVPQDIDKSIEKIKNIKLINIDYFEKLAKLNNELKQDSVEIAKKIIQKDIDTLMKNLYFHDFLPVFEKLKMNISSKSFEDIIYKLKADICAEQFFAVINVLNSYEEQV